jgi:hypothetical protein
MKPKNRPSLQELVVRLVKQIQIRNPDKPDIGIDQIIALEARWSKYQEKLYQTVKKLEIEERKAYSDLSKIEIRDVEFITGWSISGQPIIVRHIVKLQNKTKDPKRYKKQGSDFNQEIVKQVTLQNLLF